MRRLRMLFIILTLCLLLPSCGNADEKKEPSGMKNIMTFEQVSGRAVYGENGMLSRGAGNILWLSDLSTGDVAPICTLPNCEHKGESSSNPHPTCDAYIEGLFDWPALIDGTIYYVVQKENFTDHEIWSMDITGKNRKVLCTISDVELLTHAYCTERYYILTYDDRYDDEEKHLAYPITGILVIDLRTGEMKKKEFSGKYAQAIDSLYVDEEAIFFSMSYTTELLDWNDPDLVFDYDSWIKTFHSEIYEMDISTMQEKAILPENSDVRQMVNGTEYGIIQDVEKSDLRAVVKLKTHEVCELEGIPENSVAYGVGENRVIILSYEEDKVTLNLYDVKNKKTLKQVTYDIDGGMSVLGICGDKVFVNYSSGSEAPWEYISLQEIMNGEAKVHAVTQPEAYYTR